MKSLIRKATIVLIGMMVCFCAVYLGLAWYYRDGFALNTWINGVYCTGKDVETVNAELLENTEFPKNLIIYGKTDGEGNRMEWELPLDGLDVSVDYTISLQNYLAEQNPFLWIDNITLHREHTIAPELQYDEDALNTWWQEHFVAYETAEEGLDITHSAGQGYSLRDGLTGRLDTELAYAAVLEALTQTAYTQTALMQTAYTQTAYVQNTAQGTASVDLAAAGCYADIEPTAEQEQTLALWEKIQTYQTSGPIYDLGDGAWQVPAGDMAGLLVRDEKTNLPVADANGNFQIYEDTVADYIEALAEEHDTYGKDWKFTNTAGEVVTVPGGTYGTTIDQKTETQWLEAYLSGQLGVVLTDNKGKVIEAAAGAETAAEGTEDTPHVPSYTREAHCRSAENLGGTYIEVDMGRQKLYYYQNGELKIETDVVTGSIRSGRDTPDGMYYVYAKQTNRILRGPGYASHVDYWMPVRGSIGIHDADWRSEFGGDIYLTNGSHGCVNVPPEVMSELYEMTEIGTPVVLFYGAD